MEDFVWQCLLTVVTKFPAFFSGGKFFTKITWLMTLNLKTYHTCLEKQPRV
jgi:hypothetical protein